MGLGMFAEQTSLGIPGRVNKRPELLMHQANPIPMVMGLGAPTDTTTPIGCHFPTPGRLRASIADFQTLSSLFNLVYCCIVMTMSG